MSAGQRFVVLAAPRTGSNMLCSLLDSHPAIVCHHEIFNPQGIFLSLTFRGSLDFGTVSERDSQPRAFLDRFWNHAWPAFAVGFKMTRGQPMEIMDLVIADDSVRVIVLFRRNHLRMAASESLAALTDQWEAYEGDALATKPRIYLTSTEVIEHRRLTALFYAALFNRLESLARPYLLCAYEDLPAPEVRESLLAFLGVESATLRSKSIVQNPGDLSEVIVNWGDLVSSSLARPFEPGESPLDRWQY